MRTVGNRTSILLLGLTTCVAGCASSESHEVPAKASPVIAPAVAVPATRPIAHSTSSPTDVIKSASASIDAILDGTKTSTTRKGIRHYTVGPAVTTDGKRRVSIEITSVEPKRFANLTAADATSDGSASLAAYRAALVHNNPGLTDDDIVSVIHFKLADGK